ncbi:MAG: phage terminase large subunit family protein [Patescibacteria group bacterium]|nr:phage terminase large subunit family protein [Patescibacteria group bacterium]
MPKAEELARANIHLFLEHYGITNDQGEPLDFHDHPYLWDIYEDWSPLQTYKKAAQVGLSTTLVIKVFYAAWTRKMDFIYSFPTYDLARKMVNSKVNRLISNNAKFQELTKDQDSIEQKRIGKNMLYFQGTSNEQAAIALPADGYVCDERDRSDPTIVEMFASRLQHSKFKWQWDLSNPSVPENGVDISWQESDQKEWFIRCEGCNRDQVITLDHMKEDIFACEKCGRELNRRNGQWIQRFRDRDRSGYHLSTLMNPHVTPKEIRKLKKDKSEQYFANFVLGEPYVGSGNYLPRHVLFSNLSVRENPQDCPSVIGVDTGKNIHFVVGNKYGLYYNGSYKDYSPIRAILKRQPNSIAVIDQGGDITAPRELQEEFPGRVYLCTFVQAQDVAPRWKEDVGMVNTDRNKAIQLVVDEFTEHRVPLFGHKNDWNEYGDHWAHLYRELEEDDRGRRRYVWKRNGADHLALATVYWRMGMDKMLGGEGEIVGVPSVPMFRTTSISTEGEFVRTDLKRL